MTILEWLIPSMKKLAEAGVDSPRRDCLVLLEDILDKDRSWVIAHAEHILQGQALQKLNEQINRRINREPLAYIRGKAWFYGRFFEVNPDVMIPRPESESFIELLKQLNSSKQNVASSKPLVIDIGTGSGCLAITAKLELPKAEVIAIDISPQALKVAQKNAGAHKTNIKFIQGSLLEPLQTTNDQQPTTIIANLPYVPDRLVTSPEITTEPAGAIFSGPEGLDHYRQFWQQISQLAAKPAYVLTESLENQHKSLETLAKNAGYKLEKTEILVQVFKKI